MASSPGPERREALFRALSLANRRLSAALERGLQERAGISAADFEILRALASSPEGHARAGALGEMLSWEKSRVSHHVTRMEARSLVRRVSCETDMRGTWVEIAPQGREALDRAVPAYEDEVRGAFPADLSPADADAAARFALAVLRHASPASCDAEVESLEQDLSPIGEARPA